MSGLLALAAAILLAGVYVLGGRLHLAGAASRRDWISVAAGVSVAYVFIDILPDLGARQQSYLAAVVGRELLFPGYRGYLAALLGFVAYYGFEKMVVTSRTSEGNPLYRLHLAGFALYSALIGYLLVERAGKGPLSLWLYTSAMALHFLVTDHSLLREHGAPYLGVGRWLLAGAVLLGWAVGLAWPLPVSVMVVLFGFIAGGVVINSVKGELPEEGEGRFWPFALGAGGYALLLMLS